MKFLKQIWKLICDFVGGNDISCSSRKSKLIFKGKSNVNIQGNNTAPVLNGNFYKPVVNVKNGTSIILSKEEPETQDVGDIWLADED